MATHNHRSPTPTATRSGWGHPHDSVAGVQVIQYRSYQHAISIYHVRTHLLSLHLVRTALQSQKEYLDRLTSFDPLRNQETVEGDEVPPGCIEAAYLPNVLHGHGSALALRSEQEPGKVEWFIFSGPIDETFLFRFAPEHDSWAVQDKVELNGSPRRIFDLVGYAEKGLKTRTVRGANREHKGWHDSLCAAEERKKTVKLTWKAFGADLRAERERTEQAEGSDGDTLMGEDKEADDIHQDVQRDQANVTMRRRRLVGAKQTMAIGRDAVNAMPPPQPPQRPSGRRKDKEQG